jgi:hypothetical protein
MWCRFVHRLRLKYFGRGLERLGDNRGSLQCNINVNTVCAHGFKPTLKPSHASSARLNLYLTIRCRLACARRHRSRLQREQRSRYCMRHVTAQPPRGHRPRLPSPAKAPPSGPDWLYAIKHDGFRIMARATPRACACTPAMATISANASLWSWLRSRSCRCAPDRRRSHRQRRQRARNNNN